MGFSLTSEQIAVSAAWEVEAQRLKGITKSFFGDSLINVGLNGRPQTSENVVKLWHMATRALSDGVKVMSFENTNIRRFWNAIYHNLKKQNWTEQQLAELEQARPWWTGSVLDEIAEMDPAVRGTIDEILGLEGKK
jgi:phosphotransacetylase